MAYVVVCLVALVAAGLSLYSGFGLGTLLLPAFALFFPLEVAIAATAVVHLATNLFKLALVGRDANLDVVARFAIPGAAGAFAGAWLLGRLSGMAPITRWSLAEHTFAITPINLVLGALIAAFALLEVSKRAEALAFGRRSLPLGGALSGFFGGLSGHQGALRSAFLLRLGLSKQAFIGTSVVSAVVVDLARLAVYGSTFFARDFATLREGRGEGLVVAAVAAAWLGSFVGARLVRSVTLRALQMIVAAMLLLVAALLAAGII
jgi:uncharacterized membrane protein YfcA